ncbi:hypothetical protein CBS63078_480 [Aspergillus niger]|nr:hypothetical protein CBS133816_688 [Aspergillus niger]KAI2876932.1 hypothetical protein CBS115988_4209 [Aspergillus niger]KAI2886959.1 hypothetical protein CBS13152_6956 [Aspergillus niger]KAI2929997.1 hypothetical protein CBS147320_3559 [Aspergillus niger]KAI2940899.1 hypothetical protein CBS63078_480 [Aspergillus niger]
MKMASQRIAFKVSGTVQGKFTSMLLKQQPGGIPVMLPGLLHAGDALLAKHAAIYRDFTQKRATQYDVKGWVKNTHCGRVEGEAQGTEDSLQKFLKDINNGPRHAHVVKLEKKEIAPKDGEVEFGFMKTSESGYEAMQ